MCDWYRDLGNIKCTEKPTRRAVTECENAHNNKTLICEACLDTMQDGKAACRICLKRGCGTNTVYLQLAETLAVYSP